MATTRMTQRACDRCGSTEKVEHYYVRKGATQRVVFSFDACAECAKDAPLDEWERLRRGAGRRLVRSVVEPSVVERAVKAAPRKRVRRG